jgi:glycosyltransferase involved in cell wall biosynthesis
VVLRFITATPLEIRRGSGTYVGIRTLAGALGAQGHEVRFTTPSLRLPVFTAERWWFNRTVRAEACDAVVGFDLDGYRLAGRGGARHIASLKGVLADELRHERGLTRATMAFQARREALHARRADVVVTTSVYAAERARDLYGLPSLPAIVPEPIDLGAWRSMLHAHPAAGSLGRFTVLFVGRLYRRKRADLLIRAAAMLRGRIPGLEIRIVGDGPCAAVWRRLRRDCGVETSVRFLGEVSRAALATEYNRADLFCLPSVQEGFGIVFLEAMAAGRPIVAARAAAVPETAPHAALAEPGSAASLAEEIFKLYEDPARRSSAAAAGARHVEQYDAPRVARLFLERTGLAPAGA